MLMIFRQIHSSSQSWVPSGFLDPGFQGFCSRLPCLIIFPSRSNLSPRCRLILRQTPYFSFTLQGNLRKITTSTHRSDGWESLHALRWSLAYLTLPPLARRVCDPYIHEANSRCWHSIRWILHSFMFFEAYFMSILCSTRRIPIRTLLSREVSLFLKIVSLKAHPSLNSLLSLDLTSCLRLVV